METAPVIEQVKSIITPAAEGMGYEIVRVLLIGSGKPTLQIMAERPDGTMPMEDCEKLSRAVSAALDVEDVLGGAYYLEVSSPGIDRPLTRIKDFRRYAGYDAKIEVDPGIEGRRKFKGRIRGVGDDAVVDFEAEDGNVYALPFAHIRKAKLTLTDELIKSAQQQKGS